MDNIVMCDVTKKSREITVRSLKKHGGENHGGSHNNIWRIINYNNDSSV